MRTKVRKKIFIEDILYILIGVWVLAFMFSASMLSLYPKVVSTLGFVLISVRLSLVGLAFFDCFLKKQNFKRIVILGFFTFLVVIEYIVADNWLLFELFFVFIFWGERLDYRKILKIFMILTGVSIGFIVLLYYLDVVIKYDYFTNRMGRPRTTLGFHHPNSLSECLMVMLLCAFLLFWRKNYRLFLFLSIICVLAWIAIFPNTLTVVFTVLLMFAIYGILSFLTNRSFSIKKKRRLIFVISLFVVVIVFSLYYIVKSGKFDSLVPRQLESLYIRIRLSRLGLERYGITLLGTVYESTTEIAVYIKKTASEYFTIDSVYFLLPIRYGIVTTIVFAICYFVAVLESIRKSNIKLLSVLFAILIMSIVDPFVTNFIMSFIFICSRAYKMEDSKKRFYESTEIY